MENKSIWKCTYTKHIQQKRKVYQDGFLHFYSSTNKSELYDDCLKLLGVKIVQKDDMISSGETLTFNSYLVDIGELEGGRKPMLNLNDQVNKFTEKKPDLFRPNKKFTPVFAGDVKAKLDRKTGCLSPSQKIITEFKKNEMLKYGGPRNSPDATKTTTAEWQVLYTTQKTQKAKKYHDGFLRIAGSGFQGRQAILYDIRRTVLDSKFLKKDEVIESGKEVIFLGHLVDVGEPERDDNPPSELKAQDKHSSISGKPELSVRQYGVIGNGHLASSNSNPHLNGNTAAKYTTREWHALYTNQITQKAKKYQSGFLTLASSGSFQLQATLVTEDGTVLGRKFLKLSENVKSGSSFQLLNYMVEVGEPREIPEGEPPKPSYTEKDEKPTFRPSVYNSEWEKSGPVNQPLHGGETPKSALSGRKVKSTLHPSFRNEPGKRDSIDIPLHGGEPPKDALCRRELKSTFHPIIDSTEPGKSGTVDKPLRGAKDILSILKNSTSKQNSSPAKSVSLEQHDRSQSSDYSHFQSYSHTEKDVRHGTDNHIMGVLNSDSNFRGESPCIYSSPSSFFMGEEVDDFSVLNSYEEPTSKSILQPVCSTKYPQVKQEPQEPLPFENVSNGCNEAFIRSMFLKDEEKLSFGSPEKPNTQPFTQLDEEEKMDIEKSSTNDWNIIREMDDIPSFDLGFD